MEIRTLAQTPLDVITTAFNGAFADYFVDVSLTPELMAFKIAAEDIDLGISPGVFEQGELVGLMLHGDRMQGGKRIAYNAGTGVLPAHRRRGHVNAMYAFLLPRLRAQGFAESHLEVIDINAPAQRAYFAAGFEKVRNLEVWIGRAPKADFPEGYRLQELPRMEDWTPLQAFWDYAPTWQHQFATVENTWERQRAIGVYHGDELMGYALFTPFSGRVLQFAVAHSHRGKGIGKALIGTAQAASESDLRFVNVEQMPNGPGDFLYHLGMRKMMGQWELRLRL